MLSRQYEMSINIILPGLGNSEFSDSDCQNLIVKDDNSSETTFGRPSAETAVRDVMSIDHVAG